MTVIYVTLVGAPAGKRMSEEQENCILDLFERAIVEFPAEAQQLAKQWLAKRQTAVALVQEIETVLATLI